MRMQQISKDRLLHLQSRFPRPYKRLSSLASGPLPASSEIRRGVGNEALNPCILGLVYLRLVLMTNLTIYVKKADTSSRLHVFNEHQLWSLGCCVSMLNNVPSYVSLSSISTMW
jgi:hypothetical protein